MGWGILSQVDSKTPGFSFETKRWGSGQGISADADAATEAVGVIAVSLQVGPTRKRIRRKKPGSVAKGEKKTLIVVEF